MRNRIISAIVSIVMVMGMLVPISAYAVTSTESVVNKSASETQKVNKPKREQRIELLKTCQVNGKKAREVYRTTLKTDQATYVASLKTARETRDAAIKLANETYKTAIKNVVDGVVRKTAIEARKTSIEFARKAYQEALKKALETRKVNNATALTARDTALKAAHEPCVLGAFIDITGSPRVLGEFTNAFEGKPKPTKLNEATARKIEVGERKEELAQERELKREEAKAKAEEAKKKVEAKRAELQAKKQDLEACKKTANETHKQATDRKSTRLNSSH